MADAKDKPPPRHEEVSKMVCTQKGGVRTGLPGDVYRGQYDTIAWNSDKARVQVCHICGHYGCYGECNGSN